jgi:hypothetical protein
MKFKRLFGVASAAGAAVLGMAVLPLAFGAATTSAAGLVFPLLGPSTVYTQQTYGTVQFGGPNDTATVLTVSLNMATPNTTYVVKECSGQQVTNIYTCVGDATDVIQTNATGSGTATLQFPSVGQVDNVQVVNNGYGSDYFQAATSGNASTTIGTGIAIPGNGTFIGPSGTVVAPFGAANAFGTPGFGGFNNFFGGNFFGGFPFSGFPFGGFITTP